MMFAELVIDLDDVAVDVGKALRRNVPVLPNILKIAELWRKLGVTVTAMHVIAPGTSLRSPGKPRFEELHVDAWWETEAPFAEEADFEATLVRSAINDDGPIGHHALVVSTALRRSDELATSPKSSDARVIVMSNSQSVAPAVTYARGVPVMLAGTIVVDATISHARLDRAWMGMLTNRFSIVSLPDIDLRSGRAWRNNVAITTPPDSLRGRDHSVAVLPPYAASLVLFDPGHFAVLDGIVESTPDPLGVAAVVQMLGLGELVHVETPSNPLASPDLVEAQLVATLYRFSTDHPEIPIIIASGRPGLIVATSDLETYGLCNGRRFLRLCLPYREDTLNEAALAGRQMVSRVIIESSLSEPFFAEEDSTIRSASRSEDELDGSASPTLFLFTNPAVTRESSTTWRDSTNRRFLVLGDEVLEAVPADELDRPALPVSLGGCTDFSARRPNLQPGAIVEGILDTTRQRWIVVSDPIERREIARTLERTASDDQTLVSPESVKAIEGAAA